MLFSGFQSTDFHVFEIDGLDARMEALKMNVRPKLEVLGRHFAPTLASLTGDEMFAHVAKHARRTINPPNDTWVAFASNSRGYKMLPHFQIGLWSSHLFIWFALIYEAPNKEAFGKALESQIDKVFNETPGDFVWSGDHTKPDAILHSELSKDDLRKMFQRLQTVKKSELLCGCHISREQAIHMKPKELVKKIDAVFRKLIPLYKLV